TGRRAEALTLYADTRRMLSAELGVEPVPARPDPLTDPLGSTPGGRFGGRPDPLAGQPSSARTQRMPARAEVAPDPLTDPLSADPLSTGRRSRPTPRSHEPASDPLAGDPLSTGHLSTGHLAAGRISGDPLSTGPIPGRPANAPSGRFPAGDPQPTPAASRQEQPQSYAWSGTADILDDPAPATGPWPAPPAQAVQSFPAVGQGGGRPGGESYGGSSYEVRAGWAMIDESDTVTGPSPAMSTPTGPSKIVSPTGYGYGSPGEDLLSGHTERRPSPAPGEPGAPGSNSTWPTYSELYGQPEAGASSDAGRGSAAGRSGNHRAPDPDYPDYYR
ncbi:BTAD domain-containing putative transcriptional regulator, partial [Spongiactinospora sp. TRM90649]|uniref:BTAD domain-containing putative transcriptional regulator n=1 Tax=Spongiactinospora sp. TRM90649 TaxID=3031114 RepID=UPI0023F945AF